MANQNASVNKLSPMMEHYTALKKEYPGTIMMYRLGDFYEMFFDDAIEVSKLLDLTLTGRDCGLTERAPMCGVPYHAVDAYISRLIKLGKKVAICEQLSNPGDQKGMVKRDVIRVITPGTLTDDEVLETGVNNYLLSAFAAGGTTGVAYSDVSTGEVFLTEIEDDSAKLEDFLLALAPSEIISNAATAATLKKLEGVSQGKLPKPDPYYDYSFSADNAENKVKTFYKINNLAAIGLTGGEKTLCALGALLDYLEATQKRTLAHIKVPQIIRKDSEMFLDYNTKRNLELTETLNEKNKVGSLLGVLDATVTNMGARCLRRWIQEPLRKSSEINLRLDAVQELYIKKDMRAELTATLSKVRDLERLCNKIAYNSINPRECLAISFSLQQIPIIVKVIKNAKSKLIADTAEGLNPLTEISELIQSAITENPPTVIKDGGYIRAGYNNELDEYRSAQSNAKKWLAEYEAKIKQESGIRSLKLGFNRVFGYYIEVSNSFLKQVPYDFERRQTLTNGERFVTPDLKKMEQAILGAEEKSIKLEEILYSRIKELLFDAIGALQNNGRLLAVLDCINSFAEVSVRYGYTKPVINENVKHVAITEGRHPVVERIKHGGDFVANDCLIDDKSKTLIITGPNMAGKSTYMRQNALIVLMAHIGCFVPAKNAEICLVDRIFTRIGASDNLAFGQSTFMVEMTEVANILNNATENSLLILDEIGRGTSTVDGLSIAWAIVEQIALKIKAKTLFATHYHEMSVLETLIPNLKNYHILIKEDGNGITFLYKIARGSASKSFGIEVASLAGVNKSVIERAKTIMSTLENENAMGTELGNRITSVATENAVPTQQIGFFIDDNKEKEFVTVLQDINLDNCTPMQALTILSDLKKQFVPIQNSTKRGKK